jgi:uncharacterized DUF497 family protein
MKIYGIIWLEEVEDKIFQKYKLTTEEVEEILTSKPKFRFIEKGYQTGEDIYAAFGRNKKGKYLIIFFIYKLTHEALIISARRMTKKEKRTYVKK